MLEHAKLGREEELIVEHRPGDAGVRLAKHERLLKISSDGSMDPGEDDAIHLRPHQAVEMATSEST